MPEVSEEDQLTDWKPRQENWLMRRDKNAFVSNLSLFVIYFSVAARSLSHTILIAITPEINGEANLETSTLPVAENIGLLLGLLTQFYLSRFKGLRISILIGDLGIVLSKLIQALLFAYAGPEMLHRGLFFTYLTSGFFAVQPIVKSYIGDASRENQITRLVSIREACSSLAFVVGPKLGSELAKLGLWVPFAVAFSLMSLSLIMTYNFMEEPEHIRRETIKQTVREPLKYLKVLNLVILLKVCYSVGEQSYSQFYPAMLDGFNIPKETRGLYMSLGSFLVFLVLIFGWVSRVEKLIGLGYTLLAGLLLFYFGLVLLSFSLSSTVFLSFPALTLYNLGLPFITASLQSLLSSFCSENRRSDVFLAEAIVICISRALITKLFDSIKVSKMPISNVYMIAGGFLLPALLIFFLLWRSPAFQKLYVTQ